MLLISKLPSGPQEVFPPLPKQTPLKVVMDLAVGKLPMFITLSTQVMPPMK